MHQKEFVAIYCRVEESKLCFVLLYCMSALSEYWKVSIMRTSEGLYTTRLLYGRLPLLVYFYHSHVATGLNTGFILNVPI